MERSCCSSFSAAASSSSSSSSSFASKRSVVVSRGRREFLSRRRGGKRETTTKVTPNAFFGNNKDKKSDDSTNNDPLKKMKGVVNEIETKEELEEYLVSNGDRMTIVKIATSFCGPCKLMKPKFDLFAQNYSDALFLYVLSDKNEKTKALSDSLKVSEVPSFRFFRSGEQVWQYAGASEKILRMTIIDNLLEGEKR
jgi:thioredoxin 1